MPGDVAPIMMFEFPNNEGGINNQILVLQPELVPAPALLSKSKHQTKPW